jgi:hypothetical protein
MIRYGRALAGAATGTVALLTLSVLWAISVASAAPIPEDASVSRIVACDTPDEVAAFVGGDPHEQADAALARVNGQFGAQACTVATTLFEKHEPAKTVLISSGVVRIVRIDIYGVVNGMKPLRMTKPIVQYAPVLDPSEGV